MTKVIPPRANARAFAPDKPLIPDKYADVVFIGLIVLSIFIFFSSAIFSAGGFANNDNLASLSFQTYLDNAKKDGSFAQWIPYIFGGMPSYASLLTTGDRSWDLVSKVVFGVSWVMRDIFSSDVARVITFYLAYAIGMYLLVRYKLQNKTTAFFVSLAAVFSTSVVLWVMIGHNTKPIVLAMFPYIFLAIEKLRERFSLLYAALLAIALHVMLEGTHVQMIFYGGCAFGLYLVFELISRTITKRNPMGVLRAALVLVVAGGLSFAMASDRYLSVNEYTEHSTRGSAPIMKSDKQHTTENGGNDYEYATMWSFSPEETMTFFVPNYFGFGRLDYKNPSLGKDAVALPTYWGQKPFEDAAAYMGIIVFGLAIFGFWMNRKNVFAQFLCALSVFALFLSFGKTLPFLYDIFYNYVPTFNKFRAPSMALVLMAFSLPILAGYGINSIISIRREPNAAGLKSVKTFGIASLAFLALGLIFSVIFKQSYMTAVESNAGIANLMKQVPDVSQFIWSSMISDWFIGGALLVAAAALVFFFANRKLGLGLFWVGMVALLLIDLWRVDYRRMDVAKPNSSDKESFKKYEAMFRPMIADKSLFRIADFVSEQPNIPAYYGLQSICGYSPSKMRGIQDVMDVANFGRYAGNTNYVVNETVWNLMNMKYVIAPAPPNYIFQKDSTRNVYALVAPQNIQQKSDYYIFENKSMLPRAFFVGRAEVADNMAALNHLKNEDFDPRQVAFVDRRPSVAIDTVDSTAVAEYKEFKNEYIKIEANATGNNLLFVSEMYYAPCWKAYVDGQETEIYRTDFAFRSVVVPKGKHTVEFKFVSKGFETGRSLSIAGNILIGLALVGGTVLELRSRKRRKGEKPEGE